MKKTIKTITTCAIFLISFGNLAQLSILNQASLGGNDFDNFSDVVVTPDGYYAIVEHTSWSIGTGNLFYSSYGFEDFLLVKLDRSLNIIWQKNYGGTLGEIAESLIYADGFLFIAGSSASPASGNKTAPNYGDADVWIVKTDMNGNKIWDKSYGGSSGEGGASLIQIGSDFLIGASSSSPDDGNKTTTSQGETDYWVFRIDGNGEYIWQNSFGSSDFDFLTNLKADDSYIYVAGNSEGGQSGDKSEPSYGLYDVWMLKLDQNGTYIWDKTIGGNNSDFLRNDFIVKEGVILLPIGSASAASGLRELPLKGPADIWVVKLDENGDVFQQFTFGGADADGDSDVVLYDQNILLVCDSYSDASFDKSEDSNGSIDLWLLYFDFGGNILSQKSFGGINSDYKMHIAFSNDTLVLAGASGSPISGDKTTPNYGGDDGWIIQLDVETLSTTNSALSENGISIYPVPLQEKLYVNLEDAKLKTKRIELYDNLGRKIMTRKTENISVNQQFILDTSTLESGSYVIRIIHDRGSVSRTLVK
jgi:hypothetical protein